MVGQQLLLNSIEEQILDNTFPRFSIIVGERGSEKNEIGNHIAQKLFANHILVGDCKVDTIRNIIYDSYKVQSITVYNIVDADAMSVQARNALLKVTEEPPNKAYFVMTLNDINNTLPTIRSRGSVYMLAPYSEVELTEYIHSKYKCAEDELKVALRLCSTPGEIDLLFRYGVMELYNFVEKVVDHIANVSMANLFKIANSISLKDTDAESYDLILFWRAFCIICFDKNYLEGIVITSKYLSKLHIKTINKAMLFDMWLNEIAEAWQYGSK